MVFVFPTTAVPPRGNTREGLVARIVRPEGGLPTRRCCVTQCGSATRIAIIRYESMQNRFRHNAQFIVSNYMVNMIVPGEGHEFPTPSFGASFIFLGSLNGRHIRV